MKAYIKSAQNGADILLEAIQELTTLIPKVNEKLVELENRVSQLEKR